MEIRRFKQRAGVHRRALRRVCASSAILLATVGIASSPIATASTANDPVTGTPPLDPTYLKGPVPPPLSPERLAELLADPGPGQQDNGPSNEFPNLSPAQAVQLLEGVFGDQVASLVFTPAEAVEQADEVTRIIDDSAALVDPAGPVTHALIDSTVPLVAEDGQPVDLALELSSDGLETKNALVPVVLPRELGVPAEIPDIGLELSFPGSDDESSARPLSVDSDQDREVAVYPEALPDTDIALAPSTSGLEYLAQIRSAEAPETLPLELGGKGIRVEPTSDGGAAIFRGDSQVGAVSPATSIDADGKLVPTTLDVVEGAISIRVDHRGGDFAYPILMDPVIESWDWWTAGQSSYDFSAWTSSQSGSTSYQLISNCTSGVTDSCAGSGRGIYVNARPGLSFAANSFGQWVYNVPWSQFGSANNTFIASAESNSWRYMRGTATSNNPYGYLGLFGTDGWDTYKQYTTVGDGGSGNQFAGNSTTKQFIAGLASVSTVTLPAGGHRFLRVAAISFDLRDGDGTPTSGFPVQSSFNVASQVPTAWLSAEDAFQISPTFEDAGLGIKEVGALSAGRTGGWWGVSQNGESAPGVACTGLIKGKCPRSMTGNLLIRPGEMANGLTSVQPIAQDALGKLVNGTAFQIKVDNVRPVVTLSGSATSTTNPGVDLVVDASDTNGALPVSGIKRIEVLVDNESVYSEELTCGGPNQSCSAAETRNVTIPLERLLGTGNDIRVEVEDQAGNLGLDPAHLTPEVAFNPGEVTFTAPYDGVIPSGGCGNITRYNVNNDGVVYGTACPDVISPAKIRPRNPNQKNQEVTRIIAGAGNDKVFGGFGKQTIEGGGGDDTLFGGLNNDTLYGGDGSDSLFGGTGDDEAFGREGDDTLVGGGGTDTMDGGIGSDYLQGGQGSDQISGGPSNDGGHMDTASFEDGVSPGFTYSAPGDPPDPEEIDEPVGFPLVTSESRGVRVKLGATVRMRKGDDSSPWVPAPSANNGTARLGGATDALCLRNDKWGTKRSNNEVIAAPYCSQLGNFENIVGSAFSDILDAGTTTGSVALYGGSGADVLRAGSTTSGLLYGGPGGDLLNGGAASSASGWGQDGNDNCVNIANPSACGEGSASQVSAVPRSAMLIDVGAVSNQSVRGSNQGDASFFIDGSAGPDSVRAEVTGDTVVFTILGAQSDEVAKPQENLPARPEYQSVGRFRVGSGTGCTVEPTDPGDLTKGGKKATCPLDGQALGAIVMAGGPGDDFLNTSVAGEQTLTYLLGGTGRDGLTGSVGNEIIVDGDNQGGGSYAEWLTGGSGRDIIIQNQGFDFVRGSNGDDLLLNTALCDGDRVYGGNGKDNLQFAQLPAPATSDLLGPKYFEYSNRGAFVDLLNDRVGLYDRSTNSASAECPEGTLGITNQVEIVEASSNADKIRGDNQENTILGRSGRDRLIGNGSADKLFANDGNEVRHRDEQIDCGGDSGEVARFVKGKPGVDTDGKDEAPVGCGARSKPTSKYQYGGAAFAPYTETLQVDKLNPETWKMGITDEIDELENTDDPVDVGYDWLETTPPPSAEFDLDDQVGTIAANSSDRQEAGTYMDASTPATGGTAPDIGVDGVQEGVMLDSETGVNLDGVNDFVELGDTVPSNSPDGFTVSVSFMPDSVSTTEQQLYARPMVDGQYSLIVTSENRVALRVVGAIGVVEVESGEAIQPGEWHQAVGVVNRGHLELYVDGSESSVNGAPSLMSPIAQVPATAGATLNQSGLPVRSFDGLIDEIVIFDEALAADEATSDLAATEVALPEQLLTPPVDLTDADSDGYPDLQDTCPAVANPNQADSDGDGVGDACGSPLDSDGDLVPDSADNCPDVANESQDDINSDGVGDACTPLEGE